MMYAYCLISTKPTQIENVFNELSKIAFVSEAHPIFGEWDIIAKVEFNQRNGSMAWRNGLNPEIMDRLRAIPGILHMKTLLGVSYC